MYGWLKVPMFRDGSTRHLSPALLQHSMFPDYFIPVLLLRIFVKNKFNIKYLPKTIVKMRTGGASNASLGNRFRANREDRLAWEENQLKPYFFTLYLKPLRKITQFIFK